MRTFPIFVSFAGKPPLVVGGGELAAVKARLLLKGAATVDVAASHVVPELAALAEAGCRVEDIDVFELDGMTLYDEGLSLEAIGIAKTGEGLRALAQDARCNPSGGSAAGYCAPAMGLTRIVEAVLQLRGDAGANQVPRARRALASGSSLVAAQTQTVVVLESA